MLHHANTPFKASRIHGNGPDVDSNSLLKDLPKQNAIALIPVLIGGTVSFSLIWGYRAALGDFHASGLRASLQALPRAIRRTNVEGPTSVFSPHTALLQVREPAAPVEAGTTQALNVRAGQGLGLKSTARGLRGGTKHPIVGPLAVCVLATT